MIKEVRNGVRWVWGSPGAALSCCSWPLTGTGLVTSDAFVDQLSHVSRPRPLWQKTAVSWTHTHRGGFLLSISKMEERELTLSWLQPSSAPGAGGGWTHGSDGCSHQHTHIHIHAHTHARAHTHERTHTRTHKRTHTPPCVCRPSWVSC